MMLSGISAADYTRVAAVDLARRVEPGPGASSAEPAKPLGDGSTAPSGATVTGTVSQPLSPRVLAELLGQQMSLVGSYTTP